MNTNQVMSMAGGAQVSRKASVAAQRGRTNYSGKDGAFNDVLAKSKGDSLTLQDVKDLAKSAENAEKEAKLAEAAESVGTEADAPINSDGKNKTENKAAKSKDNAEELPKESFEAEPAVKAGLVALSLIVGELKAENVLNDGQINAENIDIKSVLSAFVPKDTANFNLQTILPQSADIATKGQDMLAMLSGQLIPNQNKKIDLSSFDFKNLNLDNLNLDNLDIKNLNLDNLNFDNLNFKNLNLENLNFEDLNLNGFDFDSLDESVKNILKSFGETIMTSKDLSSLAEGQINGALSALSDKLVKFVGANVNNKNELPVNNLGDFKNIVDPKHFANARVVDNVENIVNNIGEALQNIDVKGQATTGAFLSDVKSFELKAQPMTVGLQNVKSGNDVLNLFAGMNVETEDADVLPVRQLFADFGQNSGNEENQSLFNNNGDEIFKADSVSQNGAERADNNGHFAHVLETQNLQQTSNAREAAPTTALPRDDYNIREQIVQQARLVRAENGTEMVIRLKPEHLGDMTLRISVSSEGSVTASFFTNNAEVRHIVENSLVQLRQELQNQGIKVDKTEVYSGLSDGNLPQGQGQEAWQQNQSGNSSRGRFENAESGAVRFEDNAVETTATTNNTLTNDGVDYLV